MGRRFYHFVVPIVRLFIPKVEITWDVPFDGEPCVFVCNHERAIGPLEMAVNFPYREDSYLWIFADPLSKETTPAYVRQDHWWNENGRLAWLWDKIIPPVVSWILPPILRSPPHVAVYHDGRAATTMKESLRLLQDGKYLTIFPEIPTGYGEHETEKINEGWLMLLPMYQKRVGKELKIWPIHLDKDSGTMRVGVPITMDPERGLKEQTAELSRKILDGIFGTEG